MNEVSPQKSRMTYVLLGIFLGTFGVHNFYAGYFGRGIAQLMISVVGIMSACFLGGIPIMIVEIWAIVEICIITQDANGIEFK